MQFSIRLKLVAFTFCVVLLVGGAISLYSIYQGRQRIFTTFEKDARDITAVISGTIVNDLYFLDLRSLRRRLQGTRLNRDISYTLVTDLEGVVLTDGTEENALRDQKLTDPFSKEILLSGGWISTVEGEMLKVGGPIFTPDGSRIGHLYVGFSLDQAYETVRETTRTSLYITLICLGIGALLAMVLSISFSRPILSMVQASREIGEGKLDTRLPIQRGDELGTLAESINQMALNLNSNLGRMRALREIDMAITSTLDLHTVLDVLLKKIDLALPYAAATVRLYNKASGLLEPVACRNIDEEEWKVEQWKGGRGVPNVVFERKAPWMVRNVQTDPSVQDPEFFRRHGLVSYLGIPLIVKDEILGVISFYTKEEHEFSHEELEFLTTLAGQAAIAIHNSQLYEESREQAVELEKAIKVKDEFLSVMSHELRTPLNVVMGYAGMIKDRMLGEINREQERALGKIVSRSRDLLSMIIGILEATRIEAEEVKVESQRVNLVNFLDELRLAYDVPLDKELDLIWDYPPELPAVKTDSEKLKQILQNLINNAMKFTEKGSVKISVRYLPDAEVTEFKVADTGIGIEKESFPVIFEKFRQLDSSETRPYGGVGMGLYIVKKFTELLGGEVEVESEPGKGSTFTVTIPCENQQEVSNPQEFIDLSHTASNLRPERG
ncbi:MAG: GAF domain-containing protein [Deltaproteobacteria bacterium]|nr:GAF domain-containing protein [Deltaproteobacteria bacterium]